VGSGRDSFSPSTISLSNKDTTDESYNNNLSISELSLIVIGIVLLMALALIVFHFINRKKINKNNKIKTVEITFTQ
jgi:uncharacterized membrane protein YvbJ